MTDEDRIAWQKQDEPLELRLSGLSIPLFMKRKKFKTGSIGWYLSQKATLSDTPVQLSLCITVIGSKPTPEEELVYKSDLLDVGPLVDAGLANQPERIPEPSTNGKTRPKRSQKP